MITFNSHSLWYVVNALQSEPLLPSHVSTCPCALEHGCCARLGKPLRIWLATSTSCQAHRMHTELSLGLKCLHRPVHCSGV